MDFPLSLPESWHGIDWPLLRLTFLFPSVCCCRNPSYPGSDPCSSGRKYLLLSGTGSPPPVPFHAGIFPARQAVLLIFFNQTPRAAARLLVTAGYFLLTSGAKKEKIP